MSEKLNLNKIKNYLGVKNDAEFAKINMTPTQAKSLLKRCNRINRPINRLYVESLRRDMESKNWYDDIDNIGFNKDGSIINGQHRLKALSEANVESIILNISFGIEQHVSMDTGRNRTNSDQIKIFQKTGEDQNVIPNLFKTIVSCGLRINDPKFRITNSELLNAWHLYGEKFKECEKNEIFNTGSRGRFTVVKSSLFWAYLSGVSMDVLKRVSDVLNTGISESEFDYPVIRLRDILIDIKGNDRESEIKRAKYTQQCIYNVDHGSTSKRLPVYTALHYQNFHFFNN